VDDEHRREAAMKVAAPLTQLVRRIMTRIRQTTRTAVVGRVSSYDAERQRASVTPMVPEQDTVEGQARDLPTATLQDIPVVHYGGSLRGLTFGLESDDPVVLLVRHRSHQEVDAGAEPPIHPQDGRRMALSESVALPGRTTPQPDAHYRDDGQPVLYMDAGEALHLAVGTASIALTRDDLLQSELSAIWTYLNQLNIAIAALATSVGGAYTPPTPPVPAPGATATSRVKVDE
jgi:hypothetical protein